MVFYWNSFYLMPEYFLPMLTESSRPLQKFFICFLCMILQGRGNGYGKLIDVNSFFSHFFASQGNISFTQS